MISHDPIAYRRIRPAERQPMREWLRDLLDSNEVPSLSWTDKAKGEFRIKWCHGSRHGWSLRDVDLFQRWARHTGRYYFGGKEEPKRWKANFRCALNSLKTIEEVRDKSYVKGSNACRIYRMKDDVSRKSDVRCQSRRLAAKHAEPASKAEHTRTQGVKREKIKDERPMVTDALACYTDSVEKDEKPVIQTGSPATQTSSTQAPSQTGPTPVQPFTLAKEERRSSLPNFDKISPGIDRVVEFGKMHSLPHHSCGFMVKQVPHTSLSPTSIGNSNSSGLGITTICLPDSFQAQVAGCGSTRALPTPTLAAPALATVDPTLTTVDPVLAMVDPTLATIDPALATIAPTPTLATVLPTPPQYQLQTYNLPESPEASEASQSADQDDEMVELEVNLIDVSEEVTISSQGTDDDDLNGALTGLCQWQPLQQFPANIVSPTANTTNMSTGNQSSISWGFGYSPLTPP